jgi:putative nucleotidyltransferase with HDIG domain
MHAHAEFLKRLLCPTLDPPLPCAVLFGTLGSPVTEKAPTQRPRLRWLQPGRFLRDLNILAVLIVIAAGAALLLLPGSDDGLLGLAPLSAGQEAPRTVKSPRAFAIADMETTERLKKEAVEHVLPVYDLKTGLGGEVKERIETAFAGDAALRSLDGGLQNAQETHELHRLRAEEFLRALQVILDEDALLPLFKAADPDELRDASIMIAQNLFEGRMVDDRALLRLQAPDGLQLRIVDPDETAEHEEVLTAYDGIMSLDQCRAKVDELVADRLKRLPGDQRRAVSMLVKRTLAPNLVPNRAETERRMEAAKSAVKMVVIPIKPGETVVRAGERVTERHLFILRGIEKELRAQSRVQASLGSALLIVVLITIVYRFMIRGFHGFEPSQRDIAFLAATYLSMLLLVWLGYKGVIFASESVPFIGASAWRYAMPMAGFALLVRFVLGGEYALAFAPLAGMTAGWMMGSSLGYGAYVLVGSIAAGTVTGTDHPRTSLLVSGVRAAVAQGFVVVGLALLESRLSMEDTAMEVAAAVASGLLASLLAGLLLPAAEGLFAYTTDLKLTDLANLNHPLLRELLVEAPGTYHHSILVGALAEAGAQAIGANKLLAKVGAYYHDIGKIKNARAFDENVQTNFMSPTTPSEEAKEIRMHVADGLVIAAKHRLGQPVLEIIAQHHGQTVVRSSHQRAIELQGTAPVDRTEYAYPGPKPLSKEAALVLLADFVEVATRELALDLALDVKTIEAAVKDVVREVLDDGQIDSCDLTLQDIGRVVHEFTLVLEDRLIRRGRLTLSQFPRLQSSKIMRPPLGGELN